MEKEIESVMKKWSSFAKKEGLEFNPIINVVAKAESCVRCGGACPCLPSYRKKCPSEDCLGDIERAGVCYCFVFKKKGKDIDFDEYPLMTKSVRDKFKHQPEDNSNYQSCQSA